MIHRKAERLMGNGFEIAIVSDNQEWAFSMIELAITEIKRIEKLLTTFSDDSITNLVNNSAGEVPVKVPKEFFDLVERSLKISKLTQGAFDISYGGLDKRFWNFDLSMKALPTVSERKEMIKLVNYQNVFLDKTAQTVFLKEKGMRIGFGGIGKGYAAEMAKLLLQRNGVQNGFVNASGDIAAWGKQDHNQPWTIGIADPNHKNHFFSSLQINNQAIATSGNYEKYVIIDGKKYSHTIDPKTGFPVSGIKSVTIITANAELADALATPVMVMGINAGLDLINQMNGVECIIIDDDDKLYLSQNIKVN